MINKSRKTIQCQQCQVAIQVIASRITRTKFCSKKCMSISLKSKVPWNKGLIGFSAGKNHHWYGRNVTGENNPAYKKDRTMLKKREQRNDSAYQEWRKNVLNRDLNKCKIANCECSGRLEVHHILGWKEYPELRYNINNGITLCHAHHPRKRAEESRLSPFFQELITTKS